jgi:hypothetical protein
MVWRRKSKESKDATQDSIRSSACTWQFYGPEPLLLPRGEGDPSYHGQSRAAIPEGRGPNALLMQLIDRNRSRPQISSSPLVLEEIGFINEKSSTPDALSSNDVRDEYPSTDFDLSAALEFAGRLQDVCVAAGEDAPSLAEGKSVPGRSESDGLLRKLFPQFEIPAVDNMVESEKYREWDGCDLAQGLISAECQLQSAAEIKLVNPQEVIDHPPAAKSASVREGSPIASVQRRIPRRPRTMRTSKNMCVQPRWRRPMSKPPGWKNPRTDYGRAWFAPATTWNKRSGDDRAASSEDAQQNAKWTEKELEMAKKLQGLPLTTSFIEFVQAQKIRLPRCLERVRELEEGVACASH